MTILIALIAAVYVAAVCAVFHVLTVREVDEMINEAVDSLLDAPTDSDGDDLITLEFDAVRAELAAIRAELPKKRKSRSKSAEVTP